MPVQALYQRKDTVAILWCQLEFPDNMLHALKRVEGQTHFCTFNKDIHIIVVLKLRRLNTKQDVRG